MDSCGGLFVYANDFTTISYQKGTKKSILTFHPIILACQNYDCSNFISILLNSTYFLTSERIESFWTLVEEVLIQLENSCIKGFGPQYYQSKKWGPRHVVSWDLPVIYATFFNRPKCHTDLFVLLWEHLLGRTLRQNQVIQISNGLTVTSFLIQSQQYFAFLLRMLSNIFVTNLRDIEPRQRT